MTYGGRSWNRLRSSFWFVPALIVLASLVLAVVLVEIDVRQEVDLAAVSPRLFGAGAEGSRGMLSAIATSMVTVAGVVFSITIVALSLTSTQYSPRVLRNFMRDTPTQVVLGVFVGIFAYCLVVLRTIRGGDEGAFIPSLATVGAMAYALLGVAVLIYFIHHVALSIQAASIVERIARETATAIDRLFPQELGSEPAPDALPGVPLPATWSRVTASRSGYVQSVDPEAVLRAAIEADRVLRLCVGVGTYVTAGDALLEVSGGKPPREETDRLRGCVVLGRQRTVEQDAAFGLEQLVDVALRALSPGVNDPRTARMCVNAVGTLLARLAGRALPAPCRFVDGSLRVVAPTVEFGALVAASVRPVVRYGGADPEVMGAVLRSLGTVAARTREAKRREALLGIARELHRPVARMRPRREAQALRHGLRDLEHRLRQPDS